MVPKLDYLGYQLEHHGDAVGLQLNYVLAVENASILLEGVHNYLIN